jgi:hypothetical protein
LSAAICSSLIVCLYLGQHARYLYDRGRRALNCGGPTKIPILRTCAQELIPVTRAFVRAGAVPSMKSIPTARLTYQPSLSMLFLYFSAAYQSEDTDDTNDYCTPLTTPSSNGGEVRDNAARGRCTTQSWSNAPSHYQRYTWRIVDLNLDPMLRNFVLLSAHGCCVWSEHLTAPSTENPICRRLTRSGILICPPDSRPTELLAALPCCPDCIL